MRMFFSPTWGLSKQKISFETEPRICFKRNKYRLPFACHAWARYDLEFWKTAFNEMDFMI